MNHTVTIEQVIKNEQAIVDSFVKNETEPLLRGILNDCIDLSIANIADSIAQGFIECDVVHGSDGKIDPFQSTVTHDEANRLIVAVMSGLEKIKAKYLSGVEMQNDPAYRQEAKESFNLFCKQEAIKTKIVEWERMETPTALDKKAQQNEIAVLERKLKILEQNDADKPKTEAENLPWWRTEYDIDMLKENAGRALSLKPENKGKTISNRKIEILLRDILKMQKGGRENASRQLANT